MFAVPSKNESDEYFIQCAGGVHGHDKPDHFGSGLILENKCKLFYKSLKLIQDEYLMRSVAWTTFGGCYLRREFIDSVGDFDASFEWTYNRDVDYCLSGHKNGFDIYQIPVRLYHHESRDTKRIRDDSKSAMESRNLERLQAKWQTQNFIKTLDKEIKTIKYLLRNMIYIKVSVENDKKSRSF